VVVVPSNSLTTAPVYAATTPNSSPAGQDNYPPSFLALGEDIAVSGSTVTGYAPGVMMFLAPDTSGNIHVFGTSLNPASGTPTSTQVSSFSVPLNAVGSNTASNICDYGQGQTSIYSPTTLFVVIHIAGSTGCGGSGVGDSWVEVHYTDSATTPPVTLGITTTTFLSLYAPNGSLGGIALVDPVSTNLYFYPTIAFTSPATLLASAGSMSDVLDQTLTKQDAFSTSAYVQLQAQGQPPSLYQISYLGTATKCFQGANALSTAVSDTSNFYFTDSNGIGSTVYQEALGACGTPTTLLVSSSDYGLVGSNGSVVVLSSETGSFTSETSTLSTIPVGATSSSVTPLATFTGSIDAFMASKTLGTPSTDEVFVSVTDYTNVSPLTVAYSTEVLSPGSTTPLQGPTANATFEGLINEFNGNVLEITGITDTGGTHGGGTLNAFTINGLTATPFKSPGGTNFVIPAGYSAIFLGLSTTIGEGYVTNAATSSGAPTVYEYAFDQSQALIVPITVPNTSLGLL